MVRRALSVLVLAGGLAAVLVTASQTPHRSLPARSVFPPGSTGYASVPAAHHQVRMDIGQASCVLSWTHLGGIALCASREAGLLPRHVAVRVHHLLVARTGLRSLHCLRPMAERFLAKGSYVLTCIGAGANQASFSIKSIKGPKGGPDSIAVDTFGGG